jgi:hypothetical protein
VRDIPTAAILRLRPDERDGSRCLARSRRSCRSQAGARSARGVQTFWHQRLPPRPEGQDSWSRWSQVRLQAGPFEGLQPCGSPMVEPDACATQRPGPGPSTLVSAGRAGRGTDTDRARLSNRAQTGSLIRDASHGPATSRQSRSQSPQKVRSYPAGNRRSRASTPSPAPAARPRPARRGGARGCAQPRR